MFSVVFSHAHMVLLSTQKSRQTKKKFHNAQSLQENNACSAANQSSCSVVVTCLILFQDEDETDSPSKFNRAEMSQQFMVQLEERVSKIIVL